MQQQRRYEAYGRRERAEGKPPFHPASAFSPAYPSLSDRCTRTNRAARVRLLRSSRPPPTFASLLHHHHHHHHRQFSDRGCFDAARRDADHRCALSRPPPPSFRSFLPFVPSSRSFSPSRSLPRSLSSRLKTVRCTGDPARAYSPSLRSSLFARRSSG